LEYSELVQFLPSKVSVKQIQREDETVERDTKLEEDTEKELLEKSSLVEVFRRTILKE